MHNYKEYLTAFDIMMHGHKYICYLQLKTQKIMILILALPAEDQLFQSWSICPCGVSSASSA